MKVTYEQAQRIVTEHLDAHELPESELHATLLGAQALHEAGAANFRAVSVLDVQHHFLAILDPSGIHGRLAAERQDLNPAVRITKDPHDPTDGLMVKLYTAKSEGTRHLWSDPLFGPSPGDGELVLNGQPHIPHESRPVSVIRNPEAMLAIFGTQRRRRQPLEWAA